MPIGLFILIALSVAVYRHARQLGRRPGLWVILLWLSCIAGGYLFAVLAALFLPSEGLYTEAQVRSSLFVPTMIGMVVGAVAVVFAVNRSHSEPPEDPMRLESGEDGIASV